jgi:hypothetical protein
MEGRKLGYDQILWLLGADYQVRFAFILHLYAKPALSPDEVLETLV